MYQISRLLGVKPWEVDRVPLYWINRAALFERAIALAQKELEGQGK